MSGHTVGTKSTHTLISSLISVCSEETKVKVSSLFLIRLIKLGFPGLTTGDLKSWFHKWKKKFDISIVSHTDRNCEMLLNRGTRDGSIIKPMERQIYWARHQALQCTRLKKESGYNGGSRQAGGRKKGQVSDRAFIITWLTCILRCVRVMGKDAHFSQSPARKVFLFPLSFLSVKLSVNFIPSSVYVLNKAS